jgi:hypothetical protein
VIEDSFPWFEFIGLLLTGAVTLGGVWYRLRMQVEENREFATAELHKHAQAAAAQIAALQLTVSDFKLQVAREYATNNAIREVEQRVVDAINRLGDRFESFFESQNRNRDRTP